MIRFTHLHVHSYYSLLDGVCSPEELVLAAKKLGKTVRFIPADMNHKNATDLARKRNQPLPTDFRGAAHDTFGDKANDDE